MAEVQEALNQKDRQLAGNAAQVREKDGQITRLVAALNERVVFLERRAPLLEFTMPNFSSYNGAFKALLWCTLFLHTQWRLQTASSACS